MMLEIDVTKTPARYAEVVRLLSLVAKETQLIEVGALDLEDGKGQILAVRFAEFQHFGTALDIAQKAAQGFGDADMIAGLHELRLGVGRQTAGGKVVTFPNIRLHGTELGEA